MEDSVYLCEDCYKDHKGHKADYIKNLLAIEFNDWSNIMDHAKAVTQLQIDRNVAMQKELIEQLKKSSDDLPDIDAFTLQVIFRNYIERLQQKIFEVREFSKKGNLK